MKIIYKLFRLPLFISLCNVLKDKAVCEDITQEIFLQLWLVDILSRPFSEKIKRSTDITNALAILEQGGIHFTMHSKSIVVKR